MAGSSGAVDHDCRASGLVQCGVDLLVGEHGQHIEREVAAEDRRELEHALAPIGQLREPSQHGLANVVGDQQSVGIDRVVQPPFGREQPGGLTHVQRIAVGHLAHSGNELWRGTDAGRRTYHFRHAVRVQTTESQPRRVALAR